MLRMYGVGGHTKLYHPLWPHPLGCVGVPYLVLLLRQMVRWWACIGLKLYPVPLGLGAKNQIFFTQANNQSKTSWVMHLLLHFVGDENRSWGSVNMDEVLIIWSICPSPIDSDSFIQIRPDFFESSWAGSHEHNKWTRRFRCQIKI